MKITDTWLGTKDKYFFLEKHRKDFNIYYDGINDLIFLNDLIEEKLFDDCNFLITKLLDVIDRSKYAIYAAEIVLPFFEAVYPDDNRPREFIEIAKNYPPVDYSNIHITDFRKIFDEPDDEDYIYAIGYIDAATAAYSAACATKYNVTLNAVYASFHALDKTYDNSENIKKEILQYGINLYNNNPIKRKNKNV